MPKSTFAAQKNSIIWTSKTGPTAFFLVTIYFTCVKTVWKSVWLTLALRITKIDKTKIIFIFGTIWFGWTVESIKLTRNDFSFELWAISAQKINQLQWDPLFLD